MTYRIQLLSETGETCVIVFDGDTNWMDILCFTHAWLEKGWCYDWEFEHFAEFCRRCLMSEKYGTAPPNVRIAY